MNSIEDFCAKLPHADVLGRFLVAMSRFEYALKTAGFRYVAQKHVKPDWKKYAEQKPDLNDIDDDSLRKAIGYLNDDPPKKQVVTDGSLSFVSRTLNSEKNSILTAVKNVRNNAVHGGKFPFNNDRDKRLLEAALTILEVAINLDEEVRKAFYSIDVHATL